MKVYFINRKLIDKIVLEKGQSMEIEGHHSVGAIAMTKQFACIFIA